MLITAIENFVLFSTLLALATFALSYAARRAANNGLWLPRAATLTRLYTAALVFPPVTSAWLVIAALLPEFWLGRSGFDAAHSTPLHELHLISDVTAKLEPTLGYATALFIGGKTWSKPIVPHLDNTQTEHGFVSLIPLFMAPAHG